MASSTVKTTDLALSTTLSLLQDILGSSPRRDFAVRLWDGTTWRPQPARAGDEAVFFLADQFIEERWGKVEQLHYGKRLLSLPNTGQPRSGRPDDSAAKL